MNETGFSDRLVLVLKQRKISQVRVAEALGLSRTAVNKWTKGGMIDDTNLEQLAAFLDVDMIWLKYGQQESQSLGLNGNRNINEIHLQDSAEIVTWEWDLLTDQVTYSDNVEKVYGVQLTSNEDYWGLMSDEAREKLNRDYQKIIHEGGAHEMDFKISKNGQYRWITSRAAGVRGVNGKVTRLVGISMDNTERKTMELKLKRVSGFFKILMSRMDKLIAFTDIAGEILETNLDSRSGKVSYPKLQTLIYNAVIQNPGAISRAQQEGFSEFEVDAKKMAVYHHLNDDGQPCLMIEIG